MTPEETAELVKRLRDRSSEAEKFTLLVSDRNRADWQSIAALYAIAADAIERQRKRIMALEFEINARDINDIAATEAMVQAAEAVRVLERRLTKRRETK